LEWLKGSDRVDRQDKPEYFPLAWNPALGTRLREVRLATRDSLRIIQD
jgi:hypothetical protein